MMVIVVMIILIVLVLAWIVAFLMLDVGVFSDAFEVRLELTMALLTRQWADLHVDVTTCHFRLLIDMAHGEKVSLDLLRQLMTQFLMRHLTTAELKLDAHLVAFGEEVFRMHDLDQIVMWVDADAEFHFLHLAGLVMLVCFLLVLLLNVFVFAVVDDLAHGRISIRRDLDEVQSTLLGDTDGLCSGQDAELMRAVFFYDTHFRRTDALIDAGLIDKATIWPITASGAIATRTEWTIV